MHIGRASVGYGIKARHEAMLAQGICTHDEVRSVLRSVLANTELRAIVADCLPMTTRAVIVDEVLVGNRLDLDSVRIAAEAGIPTRFRTNEMKTLAASLRAGNPAQLHQGAAADAE